MQYTKMAPKRQKMAIPIGSSCPHLDALTQMKRRKLLDSIWSSLTKSVGAPILCYCASTQNKTQAFTMQNPHWALLQSARYSFHALHFIIPSSHDCRRISRTKHTLYSVLHAAASRLTPPSTRQRTLAKRFLLGMNWL